jgi:hypothetical protein
VVAAAVGCGGSSSAAHSTSSSPHAAFVAKVNGVCQRAVDAHRGHDFPLLRFDPMHPDPTQLPEVGDYFDKYGGLPATDSALHRLTPPATDAGRWHALLRLADRSAANVQRQIAAARARDVTTFVETVHEVQRLTPQIDAAGSRFGFQNGSACGKVFG